MMCRDTLETFGVVRMEEIKRKRAANFMDLGKNIEGGASEEPIIPC